MSTPTTRMSTNTNTLACSGAECKEPSSYGLPPLPFDNVENFDYYRPGGLHPVILGDYLCNGRYEVVNKLGNGGFATVWLCKDLQEDRWVAIKILGADASSDACQYVNGEMAILSHFADLEVDDEELDANHVCLAEDYFVERGPNGKHFCFVLPVLGSSIRNITAYFADEPEILKGICAQMVKAMRYLHSKGVCHGDFRSANILFKINIDGASNEEVDEMFPEVYEIPVPPIPATGEPGPYLPKYVYTSTSYKPLPGRPHPTDIVVTDFGEAFLSAHPPIALGIPLEYAAPEVVIGPQFGYSYATDIWSLAVTICEVRVGETPFTSENIPLWAVKSLEMNLGPLPQPYRSVWDEKDLGSHCGRPSASEIPLDEPVSWNPAQLQERRQDALRRSPGCTNMLEVTIRGEHQIGFRLAPGENADNLQPGWRYDDIGLKWKVWEVSEPQAGQLLDLLSSVFKYAPEDRMPIDKIMAHPWFEGRFSAADLEDDITTDAVVNQIVDQAIDQLPVEEDTDCEEPVEPASVEQQRPGPDCDGEDLIMVDVYPAPLPEEDNNMDGASLTSSPVLVAAEIVPRAEENEVFYDAEDRNQPEDRPAEVVVADFMSGIFGWIKSLFPPPTVGTAGGCVGI